MDMRKWIVGLTVSLALGSVGVAACGGDDAAGPNDNDASVGDGSGSDVTQPGNDGSPVQDSGVDAALAAQAAACHAIVDTFCSKILACGTPQFASTCAQAQAACPKSIFGDGSGMSVDQANACAAQIAGASNCSEIINGFTSTNNFFSSPPLRFFPACNIPGTRGPGDSCESSSQCASLYCSSPEGNWASAISAAGADGKCGICAPVFGPTDDCTTGLPAYLGGSICPIGQVCDATVKRCQTINAGDPCVGGACGFGATCEANPDGGVTNICATQPAAGSLCATGAVKCAAGGYCAFGDDARDDGGTCAPIVPPGGKCTESASATPSCAVGTFCIDSDGGADSFCTALPGDGQPCLDGTLCAPFSTYCDKRVVGKETCRSFSANGQPCGTFAQTYADGGPTGSTASVTCAGECSTSCATIPDSGPTGTCIGFNLGGQVGDSCGTNVCTTCAPGENCVSGKCAVATLHCE